MTAINNALTWFFVWAFAPIAMVGPACALVLVSAVTGVALAVVFRFTSNQKALKRAADQIRANLLAVKLFQHDLGVTLRCQVALAGAIGRRLFWSLPPMVVMIVPVALLLSQLGLWYEHRPLRVGEAAVLEVRLRGEQGVNVQLATPDNIRVQTPILRDVEQRAAYWRIAGEGDAWMPIDIAANGETHRKFVAISNDRLCPVPVRRPEPGVWSELLHPGEPPMPRDAAVRDIIVHQPRRATPILGFDIPWWVTFLIVSCAAAYGVKSIIKVQF